MYVPPQGVPSPLAPLSHFAHILKLSVVNMVLVSITFSRRPDEAMLDLARRKLVYTNKSNSVIAMQGVMQFYWI